MTAKIETVDNGFGFDVTVIDGQVVGAVHQQQGMLGVQVCTCGHPDCTGHTSMLSPSDEWIVIFLQSQIDKGMSLSDAVEEYWRDVQRQLSIYIG